MVLGLFDADFEVAFSMIATVVVQDLNTTFEALGRIQCVFSLNSPFSFGSFGANSSRIPSGTVP